jgi:Archaeal PaREP1/PaREP8 family.
MYKVVEEYIKALAETLNTPKTQEARKNGRWFTWLLGSAARSVANRLGRPEIVETWALAYDVHVRGFHEAKYNVDNVAWGLAYIERLLKITKDVVETSSKK